MEVWIEHETGTLTNLEGFRTMGIIPAEEEETGDTVYDLRVSFGDRTEKTITGTLLGWLGFNVVTESNLMTLARFKSETAAKTYKRFVAMTMSRSGMRHETGCVIPYVTEKDLLELAQKFKGFDAEMDARAEAERGASRDFGDKPDTPTAPADNWTAKL